jgi:hypothetical protein
MTIVNRSVRLTAYSTNSLNINTHNNGEIFFDDVGNTLRIYDGRNRGGTVLANQPWVTQTVNNSISTTVGLAVSQLEANQKKTSFSTTPPISPAAGDTWVNVSNGNMYVYFNDGTSSQWIQPARNTISLSTVGLGSLSSGTGVSETYLDTSINNILGAAPSNLNTLGKLAQAMSNDPTFLTTLNSTISGLAPAFNPTFTGTVNGITKAMVGLGNVTNESKATMFTNPTFTGTVTGITVSAETVGLGNVTNQSKTTMFNNPTFTGTVVGVSKAMVGLGNVTNESKATMFSTPTFTGTVSGVTATHVGLGNVTNESKSTMFTSPTFTGTVNGVTKAMVGLGNVTNESKTTLFSSPTFSGIPLAPTATVGTNTQQVATTEFVSTAVANIVDTAPEALNTLNELAAALGDDANYATTITTALGLKAPAADPIFTGTVSGVTSAHVGLGSVTNESKATMFTNPTFTGLLTAQQATEIYNVKTGATGTVVHDFTTGAIWSHESMAANFTANFTNIPTTTGRTIVCTLMLLQGTTPYIPNTVQIDGVAQTVSWLGGAAPTGTASKREIVSFTFIRSATGPAWFVLGSLTSYG